ncbi:MAG: phosphotransferase [Lachnospiraceae bacterium]|nr:phosphotransferase [Lachnospiraceae bacterium]
MKYKNANNILPAELIETIQQYVQGEYIYIPIKDKIEKQSPTEYEMELQKRDEHIFRKSLEGVNNKKLGIMYHLSESSIRRIIINQRKRYQTMEDRVNNILNHWNLKNQIVTQIYDTAWQVGEAYILKVYKDLNLLERNIKIITILDSLGIPVGKIVPTAENITFAKNGENYYILSEKLQGSNIVSMKEQPELAMKMGEIIANLHLAFKECETQDEFWDNSLLEEMKGWIRTSLKDSGWKFISEDKFNENVSQLEALYEKLPVQLIHRDIHFGNFLFDNGKFTGYIDFDLSQRNIRIFDLCYFMLGVLSEEEKLDVTQTTWFEILKNVFTGYQNKISLKKEEIEVVPNVMKSIELLFVAWFLGENDVKCAENTMKIYQFVDDNEDKIMKSIYDVWEGDR